MPPKPLVGESVDLGGTARLAKIHLCFSELDNKTIISKIVAWFSVTSMDAAFIAFKFSLEVTNSEVVRATGSFSEDGKHKGSFHPRI